MLRIDLKRNGLWEYIPHQAYLSGILLGGAAGLAIGFLFASQSGKRLRTKLLATAEGGIGQGKRQLEKIESKVQQTFSDGKGKSNAGATTNKIQNEFDAFTEKARNDAQASIEKTRDVANRLVH